MEARRGGEKEKGGDERGNDEKIGNNFLERQEWTERENQKDETMFRGKEDVTASPKTKRTMREKEETWEQIRVKHSKSPVRL